MKIVTRFSEDKDMLFLFAGKDGCKPMFIQCKNSTTDLFYSIDCHEDQTFEDWNEVYWNTVDAWRKNDEDRIIGKYSYGQQLTKEFWEHVFSAENRRVPSRTI